MATSGCCPDEIAAAYPIVACLLCVLVQAAIDVKGNLALVGKHGIEVVRHDRTSLDKIITLHVGGKSVLADGAPKTDVHLHGTHRGDNAEWLSGRHARVAFE